MKITPQSNEPEVNAGPDSEFDLRRYWSAFRKYMWSFLITALVVFVAVVGVTFLITPKYTATAQVMIDPRAQNAVNAPTGGGNAPRPIDPATVDSEVQTIQSRNVAEQVATVLHLDRDPEFQTKGIAPAEARRALIDKLAQGLKVSRAGLTYIINITYTSEDPDKAALIAQTFADRYVAQSATTKAEVSGSASDVLASRLTALRQEAEQADAAVQEYRIRNGLQSAQGSSLTEQEISQLNLNLATARSAQAEAEARYNTARQQMNRGSGGDVGEALLSPVITNLRGQRAQVSRSLADLETRYGSRHPLVLQTQEQLADIDAQIRTEISRVMANLEAQVQIAQQKTAAATGNLDTSRAKLSQADSASVQLNALQLNADATRQLYESFLTRYKEVSQQSTTEQSDARVVGRASAPIDPSSPNKPLMAALGLVLAVAAGAGVVILRHMLDAGLSTAEQVEQRLGVRFLGSVPLTEKSSQRRDIGRYVVDNPLSAYADAMRNIRASILFARPGVDLRTIVMTSALPGEGKTTTTISMARATAQSGASTILIDCDVRRASSARALELKPEVGLVEYLRGEATLDQVLVQDDLTPCVFLPIAKPCGDADDLISQHKMVELMEELKKRFQFIFLDTGPVLAVADTRVLASHADVTVVLTQWRKTPRKATEAAVRLLKDVDAYIAGVALTQVDLKEQARSGYGDATYYYEQYRQYYTQ